VGFLQAHLGERSLLSVCTRRAQRSSHRYVHLLLLQAMLAFCHTVLPARNPAFSVVEMPHLLLDPRVRADLGRGPCLDFPRRRLENRLGEEVSMETDVAAFAKLLKQDGIDAARAEASGILDEARTRAAEIVRQAQAAAGKVLRDAQSEIESLRQRQAVEIRLVARDAMLKVKEEIERVALLLLRQPIAEALTADEVVRAAIVELVQNSASGQEWEIRVGPRIGKALVQATVNDLFKGREAAATLIEEFRRSGLEFRSGAGEVLELSEESVTDLFRRLMSPELSRLLDSRPG